jgi:hypothetical protein
MQVGREFKMLLKLVMSTTNSLEIIEKSCVSKRVLGFGDGVFVFGVYVHSN